MIKFIKRLFPSKEEQYEFIFEEEPDVMMSTKSFQLAQDWAYVKGIGVGVTIMGVAFALLVWLLPY